MTRRCSASGRRLLQGPEACTPASWVQAQGFVGDLAFLNSVYAPSAGTCTGVPVYVSQGVGGGAIMRFDFMGDGYRWLIGGNAFKDGCGRSQPVDAAVIQWLGSAADVVNMAYPVVPAAYSIKWSVIDRTQFPWM